MIDGRNVIAEKVTQTRKRRNTNALVGLQYPRVCVCWQRWHANSVASGNMLIPSVVVIS